MSPGVLAADEVDVGAISEESVRGLDVTGQRFGRLTAIRCVGTNKHRQCVWECVCDCGREKRVVSADLRQGHAKSCGCAKYEFYERLRHIHKPFGWAKREVTVVAGDVCSGNYNYGN